MRSSEKVFRIILTILITIGIAVLSYMLYLGLSREGTQTEIGSSKTVADKNSPQIKDTSNNTLPPELPKIDETPEIEPPVDTEKLTVEDNQPSIIVEKPIRREQEDKKRPTSDLQSSEMHADGTILEELEVIQSAPEESQNENTALQEALKLKKEREERNQGRKLAALEVSLFVDSKGEMLDTSNILSKGIVLVAWQSTDVEYLSTLNKLYSEYKDKLNIIFLSRNSDNKEEIENIVSTNGFSFKCYYDATLGYSGYIGLSDKTEVLLINKDDYVVNRVVGKTTEKDLKLKFDELLK